MDPGKWAEPNGIINKGWRRLTCRLGRCGNHAVLNLGKEKKALIGGRPLRASDIAVLVRENKEALLVQKVLSARNVPSVLHSTENLFDSHEAMEMARFLFAVVEPGAESLVKTALSTDMVGSRVRNSSG